MTGRRWRAFTLVTLFLVFWSLTTHGKYSDTGDEPHYLIVDQSLLADGDLDVQNNYAQGDAALFGAGGLLAERHAVRARDGRLRPVHDIGVPVVLLPVYALAEHISSWVPVTILTRFRMNRGLFAYSIISLFIMAIVVAAASATITALTRLGCAPRTAALTVLALFGTAPVLLNAFEVFPEPFALLVTAWAVREWARRDRQWTAADTGLVLALGVLPWFHRKYVPYSTALLIAVCWERRTALLATRPRRGVAVAMLFGLPIAALGAWTYRYWGNLGGPLTLEGAPFSVRMFGHGAPGLFLDRENGLFWWAPVYLLLPAAWVLGGRTLLVWLLPVASLIIPAAAHDQWWGGFSAAGRFLTPLVPIFCLALTRLTRIGRRIGLVLLVPQVAIAAYGWQHPHALWPRGDGENRALSGLLGAFRFSEAWLPSFRVPAGSLWSATAMFLIAIAIFTMVVLSASRRASTIVRLRRP